VVLDGRLERRSNTAAFGYLAAHGVQVRWAPPRFAASHEKAIIVDRRTADVMTLNLTSRYYPTTRDFAVSDSDPGDVAAIEEVFDADFAGVAISAPNGDALVWSPGSQPALVALISSARRSVSVEDEEMSAPAIANALAADAKRGVMVTVVMTADSSWAASFATLTAAGAQVRTFSGETPIYIHAKVFDVDAATPTGRVFIGSENASVASLDRNRELGVVIATPGVVTSVAATVAGDFGGATPWRP
jgi:cardiolipin synthase